MPYTSPCFVTTGCRAMLDNVQAKWILAEAFGLLAAQIPDDVRLDNFEPWDSLGHVKVLLTLEKVLGRNLSTEEAIEVIDLPSLTELLDRASA